MVTGDNIKTARAIALECGILTSESDPSELIEGSAFRVLSDTRREEVAEKISVWCNCGTSKSSLSREKFCGSELLVGF